MDALSGIRQLADRASAFVQPTFHASVRYTTSWKSWCAMLSPITALVLLSGCPVPDPDTGRVGTATCLVCHDGRIVDEDMATFLDGPHRSMDCEDCHGAGAEHVRTGGRGGVFINNPGDAPFDDVPAQCAACHEEIVAGYERTAHFLGERAACTTCHDVHKPGGMRFPKANRETLDTPGFTKVCGECHRAENEQFLKSRHAQLDILTCGVCHDVHVETTFKAPPENNQLCQQCHASYFLGLDSPAAVQEHIGIEHVLDPEGTGSGRCTACHMPPLRREQEGYTPHDHSLLTIAPAVSSAAIANGQLPNPNSCAGTTGCHDAAVPGSGAPYDLDSAEDNDALQLIYDQIGFIPERSR
jgi:nitrate/TMAO reductase-like tetraheme cytochrome c subunit